MTLRGLRGRVGCCVGSGWKSGSRGKFGADYHYGINAFCIFSMKIPLLGIKMVKLKEEVEPWGLSGLFTFCEIPIFLVFENISTKANGRRVDMYHLNVNIYDICWNYLKFSCDLMLFVNWKLLKIHFWSEQNFKLREDSIILALVMYILVYYYLINTYLTSHFVEFCSKIKNHSTLYDLKTYHPHLYHPNP